MSTTNPEHEERGHFSSLPDARNISAEGIPDRRLMRPRRPPVSPSDPFGATYVSDGPDARPRRGGQSGRFLRQPAFDEVGVAHSMDQIIAHRKARKAPSERTDWSRSGYRADQWAQAHGGLYPAATFDGSNATLGMRCSDAERHGCVVPDYARADYVEDFDADNGMV